MTSNEPRTTELDQQGERPFPWHCPRCCRKEIRRTVLDYQCQRPHDGGFITVSVSALEVPCCEACGELVFDYRAEAQINAAARKQAAKTLNQ
jgi:hypothetical protein